MLAAIAQSLMLRELAAVRRSDEAYPDDASLWAMPHGSPNSAGTLVLHLAGNLRHYVGAVLGGDAYVRDRPAEFSRRDVQRRELLGELAAAEAAIARTLPALSNERLSDPYPEAVAGHTVVTGLFLLHLVSHLAYHLGQIDYHRRIVTGDATGIGALPIGALAALSDS